MGCSRIYTYKITFKGTPFFYYGVHKENKPNENYLGSPVTNKWAWDFYEPRKQILEFFDPTEEGWKKAQEVEGRIIRQFLNSDPNCLNAHVQGVFSTEQRSKAGKIGGKKGGRKTADSGKLRKSGLLGAAKGGKITAAKLNTTKYMCPHCGMISITGPLSYHMKSLGLDPKEKIPVLNAVN